MINNEHFPQDSIESNSINSREEYINLIGQAYASTKWLFNQEEDQDYIDDMFKCVTMNSM